MESGPALHNQGMQQPGTPKKQVASRPIYHDK